MIYEISQSAQQPPDNHWRHIFSLPISTFSVWLVERNTLYKSTILTYLLTYSQPVLCDLDLRHPLYLSIGLKARRKGKGSGFILRLTFNALKYGSQFYLQITPYLSLRRKRSPDDATADYGGRHLIAAYYSFIDPERMKGWVGLVGWPTADGLPT